MATLQEERRRAQFDLQAMKVLLAGGEEALRVNDRIANLVVNDPVLDKSDRVSLDRKALFQNTLQKAKHVWELILENRLSEEEALKLRSLVDQPSYTDLHWGMFIPSIKGQGTEEQQQKWLPLAYKMAILGAYAQTEMGHGSNVQGLETTATFDIETDEFVLHTPTLTATKWWPGALGKVATHAIVYAQLIIGAKEYGVHAFVVQIRSLEDHNPLPGIAVGDIGVKFGNGGYNSMDNGFLSFDHFRIPRDHLLMRLATVTKDGKYVKSGAPRQLGYGAMVFVRQSIVAEASIYLSRAITISVRYSAVRRQFGGSGDRPEVQAEADRRKENACYGYQDVIDYKTQQHKLFSLLATTYAYRFLGQWMKWLYADVMARLEVNDYSTLPEVHACTAGLKSVTTAVTADGIEECRKLCGGHGYLCASGLPELYAAYVPACTYEGDNTILLLQVARFVMKTLSQLGSGIQPVGTASYFRELDQLATVNCNIKNGQDWLIAGNLQKAFEARSARLAASCAERIAKAHNPEAAFDKYSVDLVEAARAHCQVIIVSKFLQKSEEHIGGRGVKDQLIVLSRVYALSLISTHLGEFLSTGFLTSEQAVLARDELRELYPKVRTNAVALVDAFNHTDHYLGSALGRYDGDVYTHLYKSALRDPWNETVVVEGYEDYLRPILMQEVKGLHSRL